MAKRPPGETDWMKYFCFIFGALVLVVGFMYFKASGDRKEYEKANVLAEKLVTGEGLPERDSRGVPNKIPDLAVEVNQYVNAYKDVMGGAKDGVSQTEMSAAATGVNMSQIHASPVRVDEVRSKNYQTISRDFTYAPCTLEQLVALMYNVEAKGRLRVFEVRWQLAETKQNSEAPFHKLRKPVIKVGMREPLATR